MEKYHFLSPLFAYQKPSDQAHSKLNCTYYQYAHNQKEKPHIFMQCSNQDQTIIACLIANPG